MRPLVVFAVLSLPALLVAAPVPKKKDQEAIEGLWKAEKLDNGKIKDSSDEYVAKLSMKFTKDGKLTINYGNGKEASGDIKLDPTTTPKRIDLNGKKQDILGIYELDGDCLKLCLAIAGDRPTEFKSDGKLVSVYTMKRVKEEKKDK